MGNEEITREDAMRKYIAPKQENIIDVVKENDNRYEIFLHPQFEIEVDNGKYYAVCKKPYYPKNYCECCQIVGDVYEEDEVDGYKQRLLFAFQRLLRCRDAYWKIAGEEMGLGKPWNPCIGERAYKKFVIQTVYDEIICLDTWCQTRNVLEFPTPEIRDAFYENFKGLIKDCKELL